LIFKVLNKDICIYNFTDTAVEIDYSAVTGLMLSESDTFLYCLPSKLPYEQSVIRKGSGQVQRLALLCPVFFELQKAMTAKPYLGFAMVMLKGQGPISILETISNNALGYFNLLLMCRYKITGLGWV
jgi:hypothetical protein